MGAGMKRIGIPEIARLANVTIATVDRALHGRKGISEDTRKRILEIARSVGYRPNPAARALSSGRPLRIGVCIPKELHYYFDQLRQGILTEARRAEPFGLEMVWREPERLGSEAEHVTELLEGGLSALILTPGEPGTLGPVIDEAERRNVRVICVDTDAPGTQRSTAVCVDAEVSGNLAAELMGGFVPAGASVAVVTGMLATEDHRRKTQAFLDTWPQFSGGGSVVEVIEAHEDEEEGFQKCYELLSRHESLAGVYVSTVNCLPVCRALGVLGRAGRIRLITSDLFREMRPYFEKGTISASIYARPYVQGEIAMRVALDHLVHGAPMPQPYYLAPQVIMRSTFHLYREMRQRDSSDGRAPVPETISENNAS